MQIAYTLASYQCPRPKGFSLSMLLVTFLFCDSPSIRYRRHTSVIIIFLKNQTLEDKARRSALVN